MFKDRIVAGAIIGVLADLVKLGFNYLAFRLGFAGAVFWRVVATEFVRASDLGVPLAVVIGAIADLTTSAVLGTIFLYLLEWAGDEYLWFKGAGFGLVVWVALFGLLVGKNAVMRLALTPANIMVTPIAHLLFGLALAFLAPILAGTGRPASAGHGKSKKAQKRR